MLLLGGLFFVLMTACAPRAAVEGPYGGFPCDGCLPFEVAIDSLETRVEFPDGRPVATDDSLALLLSVKNVSSSPSHLHLAGSTIVTQFLLTTADGDTIWNSLTGAAVGMTDQHIRLETGEELTVTRTLRFVTKEAPVPPGDYLLKGGLYHTDAVIQRKLSIIPVPIQILP